MHYLVADHASSRLQASPHITVRQTTSTRSVCIWLVAESSGQSNDTLPRKRRQLSRVPLLIIDDLGIGGIDVQLGPILLDILDQQSMEGALIITSQYPPEKWYDLFGDPTVADAILDRVVHRAHAISLKGESMRKLKAKKIS